MNPHTIFESNVAFHDGDGFAPLVVERTQEITPEYLADLRAQREGSMSRPMGDFARVASIPVSVYETWLRQGFDVHKEPISKTLARLQTEGLDAFITTNKRIH